VQHRILRYAIIAILLSALAVTTKIAPLFFWRLGPVAVISAMLVFIVSHDKNILLPEGTIKRVALWIGSRSYALYLTHIPAYLLTREAWWRAYAPDTQFGPDFSI